MTPSVPSGTEVVEVSLAGPNFTVHVGIDVNMSRQDA
jgi:hypothetical protein